MNRSVALFVVMLLPLNARAMQERGECGPVKLTGQLAIVRLIDLSAERLGLNIEYDASALRGEITLRLDGGISHQQLWSLTNHVLAMRGFTTVASPDGETISVVRLSDATKQARLELERSSAETGANYAATVDRARHQPVQSLIEAMEPLLSTSGSITGLGDTDLILLSDHRSRIEQLLRLKDELDVPTDPPVIEVIAAEFLDGTQLAAQVTAAAKARDALMPEPLCGKITPTAASRQLVLIAPKKEIATWRSIVSRFDIRTELTTRTYQPLNHSVAEVGPLIEQVARDDSPRGSGELWQLVADDLTGTLVVRATVREHDQIEQLVERLNALPAVARQSMRTLTLRNRAVGEVVELAHQLLETNTFDLPAAGEPVFGDSTGEAPNGGPSQFEATGDRSPQRSSDAAATRRRGNPPAPQSAPTPIDGRMQITADEETNTLIAVGDSRTLDQLEQLIRQLDVRQPQVMIEVMVVSLTEGDTLDLGVELEKLEISGSTMIRLSSLFGLGGAEALVSEMLPEAGNGFTGVALNPGDFSVIVRALQTINTGRTLSWPKTLVNNNEQATLDSVIQEPFTSTNASNTVATTSFAGTQDAGTQVTVTPHIAEGDHVVLEYSVSLSSFTGESSDPSLPPPRQQTALQSVVTIPDGYTIVLGGLENTSEADAVSQVPLLADIPLIGELFKNRSRSQSRSRFYVFIRADVMRHEGFEDLKYLSDVNRCEAEFDDGWPEVKPRIIR